MLFDLELLKFYEGDDGGGEGAGTNPTEPIEETPTVEPVENTGEAEKEDLISFKKDEFEQRLNNKFAEGAKKAESNLIKEFGFESKEDFAKTIKAAKELEQKYNEASSELSQLKAEKLVVKAGGDTNIAENVIALIKGKGQDLTEDNIKAALEVFQPTKGKGFGTAPRQNENTKTKKQTPRVF